MNPETHRQRTEDALRHLESHGFDVKALWVDLSTRIAAWESGTPSDDDKRYTLPLVAPAITDHLGEGRNQLLSPEALWPGYSYQLSPGQRAILRETYGLTPTQTITVLLIDRWPGTQHPRSMTLKSDLHVDPRQRRHVLTSCVVREVGTFFRLAREKDEQEELKKVTHLVPETLEVGRVITLESDDRWAIADITGVKLGTKVEVTGVSADRFVLSDVSPAGNTAKVPRAEFFTLVKEYAALHEADRAPKGRRTSSPATPSLDALIASLDL